MNDGRDMLAEGWEWEECDACHGTGIDDRKNVTCAACEGEGTIWEWNDDEQRSD